jgi:hypothetical protein
MNTKTTMTAKDRIFSRIFASVVSFETFVKGYFDEKTAAVRVSPTCGTI